MKEIAFNKRLQENTGLFHAEQNSLEQDFATVLVQNPWSTEIVYRIYFLIDFDKKTDSAYIHKLTSFILFDY